MGLRPEYIWRKTAAGRRGSEELVLKTGSVDIVVARLEEHGGECVARGLLLSVEMRDRAERREALKKNIAQRLDPFRKLLAAVAVSERLRPVEGIGIIVSADRLPPRRGDVDPRRAVRILENVLEAIGFKEIDGNKWRSREGVELELQGGILYIKTPEITRENARDIWRRLVLLAGAIDPKIYYNM